jgi:hypothetical protein
MGFHAGLANSFNCGARSILLEGGGKVSFIIGSPCVDIVGYALPPAPPMSVSAIGKLKALSECIRAEPLVGGRSTTSHNWELDPARSETETNSLRNRERVSRCRGT